MVVGIEVIDSDVGGDPGPGFSEMRVVARSSGPPWLRSILNWAQGARWSPKVSRMQWHRQAAEKDDEGSWCRAHVKWWLGRG